MGPPHTHEQLVPILFQTIAIQSIAKRSEARRFLSLLGLSTRVGILCFVTSVFVLGFIWKA